MGSAASRTSTTPAAETHPHQSPALSSQSNNNDSLFNDDSIHHSRHRHLHHNQNKRGVRRSSTPQQRDPSSGSPIFFAVATNHGSTTNRRNSTGSELQYVSEQSGLVMPVTAGIFPAAARSSQPPALRSLMRTSVVGGAAAVVPLGLPTAMPTPSASANSALVDGRLSPTQLVATAGRFRATPLSGSLRQSSATSSLAIAQDTISLSLAQHGSCSGGGSLFGDGDPPLILVPSPMTTNGVFEEGQCEIPSSPRPTAAANSQSSLLQFLMDGGCAADELDNNCATSTGRHHHHRSSSQQHHHQALHAGHPQLLHLRRAQQQHYAAAAAGSLTSARSLSHHSTPTSHPDPHLFELMSSWSTAPSVDARSTIDLLKSSLTHREHSSSHTTAVGCGDCLMSTTSEGAVVVA